MASFLIVIVTENESNIGRSLFHYGLGLASYRKYQASEPVIESEWAYAASFVRKNGSQTKIARDLATGSWLLASGTWFHENDLGSGNESALLSRFLTTDVEKFSAKLEGFFTIIIGDALEREIFLITDIIGSHHCYMRNFGKAVALSGSPFILASLGPWTLDSVGCQEFLYTGIIYENRTFYNEVKRLDPGCIYRFSDGKCKSTKRYWSVSDLDPNSLRGKQAVISLGESLCDVAKRISRVFQRPVCDLTGGYDSRVVFSSFLSAGIRPATFVAGPPDSADVRISRSISNMYNVPHIHFDDERAISFEQAKEAFLLTDGEYDIVEYSKILQAHMFTVDNGYDISVIGSFGEIARGVWWALLYPNIGTRRMVDAQKVSRIKYAAFQNYDPSLFPSEKRLHLPSHLANVLKNLNAQLIQFPNTVQMDNWYLFMRMRCWYGKIASSSDRIRPCVSPFQFRSVLETMLQTDWHLRHRSRLITEMLAEFQPRLAEVPLARGYPALPVRWHNFYRFIPMLKNYANRAIAKTRRTLTGKRLSHTDCKNALIRLQLWRDEEVQEILNPSRMATRTLLDANGLSSFIKRSQEENFIYNSQWTRLLSLEYCLSVLESSSKIAGIEIGLPSQLHIKRHWRCQG